MTLDELYAEAMQNYAMSHHYLSKLKTVLDQMASARSGEAATAPVRCVREWQDWLTANGPALKSTIHEGTGVKFTERGTAYTVDWVPSLATAPDDRFAPTTLMKISSKSDGRGAPPKVYFLWSQRFDVYPRFGVGPDPAERVIPTGFDVADVTWPTSPDGGTVLGVVAPVSAHPIDPEFGDEQPFDWTDVEQPAEGRFATMSEWDAHHGPYFDSLVSADRKPTDDEKESLLARLPEGSDPNAAVAIAYRAAVTRAAGST